MQAARSLDIDRSCRTELLQRLDFRIEFLELLSQSGAGIPPSNSVPADLIKLVEKSSSIGQPSPDAFNIKIQRRLASSVPPRPMITSDRDEAFTYFSRMLAEISAAVEILSVHGAGDLYTAFWTFMSRAPPPCVYVRSLVQSFLTLDEQMLGRTPLHDTIVEDLQATVLPASVLLDSTMTPTVIDAPSNPHYQVNSQMTQFITKISIPFQNQYRSFALNRSRVRRNLCHAAIEWDNIQAEAEEIDGYLQTLTGEKPLPFGSGEELAYAYPLSSWIYHYKLLQLRLLIQMGFELEVYAPFEYVDMYWYLSHIASLHLSHLERISFFISQARKLPHWTAAQHEAKSQSAPKLLYRHFSILKATDTLASALQRVFVVVRRHQPVERAAMYSSDELRYELRMRPFQHLSVPEPFSYAEMKALSSLEGLSDAEILEQAQRLALTSRKAWEEVLKQGWCAEPLVAVGGTASKPHVIEEEWTRNVKNSMRACIGTSIAATTISKAIADGREWKVTVAGPDDGDRLHRWWAVPKVVL